MAKFRLFTNLPTNGLFAEIPYTSSLISYRKLQYSTSSAPKELKTPAEIHDFLSQPSWSTKDLLKPQARLEESQISRDKLHHLLRLSALPLPTSDAEEQQMIKDLESQLTFVQSIQEIDTEGIEPLQSIRDETKRAQEANIYDVSSMQKYLNQEAVYGKRRRISRIEDNSPEDTRLDGIYHLSQAPKKRGRYIRVDTTKD